MNSGVKPSPLKTGISRSECFPNSLCLLFYDPASRLLVSQPGCSPTNAPLQKCQVIIKDACSRAGIELELKAVVSAVFFGGDSANPDTFQKFWADIQLFSTTMHSPDPERFIGRLHTGSIAQKVIQWSRGNHRRWSNAEFDALHDASQTEMDPVKRAAMFIRMNDLAVSDGFVIPLSSRTLVTATANRLEAALSPWDSLTWALGHWHREG